MKTVFTVWTNNEYEADLVAICTTKTEAEQIQKNSNYIDTIIIEYPLNTDFYLN